MSKVKSTLVFVKLFPAIGSREETPITIVSDKKDSNKQVSDIIDAWVQVQHDSTGKINYQCYLKSIDQEDIYLASQLAITTVSKVLSYDELFDYIIENKVKLVPTPLKWTNEDGTIADYVTHDVYIDKQRYQGMSVYDLIHVHINKVNE